MRVERYRQVASSVLALLRRWGRVEKTSYDDFYVDVTAAAAAAAAVGVGGAGVRVWRSDGPLLASGEGQAPASRQPRAPATRNTYLR